ILKLTVHFFSAQQKCFLKLSLALQYCIIHVEFLCDRILQLEHSINIYLNLSLSIFYINKNESRFCVVIESRKNGFTDFKNYFFVSFLTPCIRFVQKEKFSKLLRHLANLCNQILKLGS